MVPGIHSVVLLMVTDKILVERTSFSPVIPVYLNDQCGFSLIRSMSETSVGSIQALISPHCHQKLKLLPVVVGNIQLQNLHLFPTCHLAYLFLWFYGSRRKTLRSPIPRTLWFGSDYYLALGFTAVLLFLCCGGLCRFQNFKAQLSLFPQT